METLSNGCFYGSVLKRDGIAGFLFTETIYPPGLKIAKHSHEYPYFCYVRQGVFSETNSRRTRYCKPSTLIFHPPQERHSNAFHHGVSHCFNIQIEHHWLDRAREQAVVLNEPFDFRGGLIASLVARLYHEFHHLDAVSSLAIEGLMLEVVAEAARQHVRHSPGKPPRWLEQAREVIHANFSESLTVAGVAEAVGVHPVHLARSFRRFYHCTVGEYVRQVRVEFTRSKMSYSGDTLAEIASMAGFTDQSHFSKTFKRLTGHTPAEFRSFTRSR